MRNYLIFEFGIIFESGFVSQVCLGSNNDEGGSGSAALDFGNPQKHGSEHRLMNLKKNDGALDFTLLKQFFEMIEKQTIKMSAFSYDGRNRS